MVLELEVWSWGHQIDFTFLSGSIDTLMGYVGRLRGALGFWELGW